MLRCERHELYLALNGSRAHSLSHLISNKFGHSMLFYSVEYMYVYKFIVIFGAYAFSNSLALITSFTLTFFQLLNPAQESGLVFNENADNYPIRVAAAATATAKTMSLRMYVCIDVYMWK